MMRRNGFTLIELLVVTVILGVLAAFAVPAYQDYIVKARVTEGLNLAQAAKLAVAEAVMINNVLPEQLTDLSYENPEATKNVASLVIGTGGVITITYTKAAGEGTIIMIPDLKPNGNLSWDATGGTLAAKYRPESIKSKIIT